MEIREIIENNEKIILSSKAQLSIKSRGRNKEEKKCPLRTDFMRDRDRIIHSEAFRRLKHKTQVFFSPSNDLFRTRLTHTLEVSQISRTIAKALKLNEDLTEAIALGHDLGHAPFGHTGEAVLSEISNKGFYHAEQSYRIVELIEKGGLNLTFEVKDGILKHSKRGGPIINKNKKSLPATLEGEIVRICDRIAYLNHDLDDAIRADILRPDEIPKWIFKIFGDSHSKRINTMVKDIIQLSLEAEHITMSEKMRVNIDKFKDYMYSNVYKHPAIVEEGEKTKKIIEDLFNFFLKKPEKVVEKMADIPYPGTIKIEEKIIDYIVNPEKVFLDGYFFQFLFFNTECKKDN